MTRTHDYARHGTTSLFAPLDVKPGTVIGKCMRHHLLPPCARCWRGTNGSACSSTILHTLPSERSHAPRGYSSLLSSSPAMVAAKITPRLATTHSRPMERRSRKRSTTGSSVVTSAVFSGHISVQISRPSPSTAETEDKFRGSIQNAIYVRT